jgi:Domain of unknown function (DUF4426)
VQLLQFKFKRDYKIAALCWCTLALYACSDPTPPKPAPAQASPEMFAQVGDYQLHYNALSTTDLAPEIAQQYGIQRSSHRGMVIVSVQRKSAQQPGVEPIAAELLVESRSLLGQIAHIPMRRIDEGKSISYIGEVEIHRREVLLFDIKATPALSTQVLATKFQHEFFVD